MGMDLTTAAGAHWFAMVNFLLDAVDAEPAVTATGRAPQVEYLERAVIAGLVMRQRHTLTDRLYTAPQPLEPERATEGTGSHSQLSRFTIQRWRSRRHRGSGRPSTAQPLLRPVRDEPDILRPKCPARRCAHRSSHRRDHRQRHCVPLGIQSPRSIRATVRAEIRRVAVGHHACPIARPLAVTRMAAIRLLPNALHGG